MGDTRTSLLLHPVRLRILQAALGREVTTAQLAGWLEDVPTATLYRHVSALIEGGVLEVIDERQGRGAAERTLRVALPAASLGPGDITDLSPQEHLDAITAFLAGVLQAATDYLRAPGAEPAEDGYGYRQVALWADDQEIAELSAAVRALLGEAQQRGPAPGRRRRVLTTVLLPDPASAPLRADAAGSPPS